MNHRKTLTGTLLAAALLASGCTGSGGSSKGADAGAADDPSKVSGTITVLTHRTDIVQDGTMKKYADAFNKTYPKVKVKFDGITDYEAEVKIRMNTENYGDVLMIPAVIQKNDYPKFFASLGTQKELSEKYRFTGFTAVDGKVYGQSPMGATPASSTTRGSGPRPAVTDWPTTPAEFLTALKAIKSRTDAVPYYTNFAAQWPLTQWTYINGSVSCDTGATTALAEGNPWGEDGELRVGDRLLYDIVDQGLIEKDPATTNWENSKPQLAKGEIATAWLGSWAVTQFRQAAEKAGADPDDIGFMPFPARVDGKACATANPDYNQAVNIHSEHKEAARAWIDWFTDKSGYAADNLSISTLKDAPLPEVLKPYEEQGVELIELDDTAGGTVKDIDSASEVGIYGPAYRQELIDLARGAKDGDVDDFLADLGKRWTEAQKTVGS